MTQWVQYFLDTERVSVIAALLRSDEGGHRGVSKAGTERKWKQETASKPGGRQGQQRLSSDLHMCTHTLSHNTHTHTYRHTHTLMCKKKFPYIAAYIVAYQAAILDTHGVLGRPQGL